MTGNASTGAARKVTDIAFEDLVPAELNPAFTVVLAVKERAAAVLG